jgi:small subunit ribosomal protein S13
MRILGINIPNNKHLYIGLTSLYGIGIPRAKSILKEVGIDPHVKADTLTIDQENAIRKVIESLSKGDGLEVSLQITQRWDDSANTYVNKSYQVIKIARHIPRNEQGKLDLN